MYLKYSSTNAHVLGLMPGIYTVRHMHTQIYTNIMCAYDCMYVCTYDLLHMYIVIICL